MRLKQAGIFRRLWWWVAKQLRRRAKVTRIAEAVLPARKGIPKRGKQKRWPIGWIVQTWGPNRHERRAALARARHHDDDLRARGRYRRRRTNAGNRT